MNTHEIAQQAIQRKDKIAVEGSCLWCKKKGITHKDLMLLLAHKLSIGELEGFDDLLMEDLA